MATTDMRYDANKKSLGVAYLLWFFLGGFGAHRFYLGLTRSAVIMLILCVVTILTFVIVIGMITGFALGIWWIVDAFLIPGIVQKQNNALIDKISAETGTAPSA